MTVGGKRAIEIGFDWYAPWEWPLNARKGPAQPRKAKETFSPEVRAAIKAAESARIEARWRARWQGTS